MEGYIEKLCELKKKFICALENQTAMGLDSLDTHEAYEVVDIIKDLCEAENYCQQAAYYEAVTAAMDEAGEGRYGYNHRRYSNGRYAPKGAGMRSGYVGDNSSQGYRPMVDMEPYVDEYLNGRMGYHGMPDDRYGRSFNEFTDARRHYTETKSDKDHDTMKLHANEHIADTMVTLKEIWSTADTDLKRKMKADLTSLLNDMTV